MSANQIVGTRELTRGLAHGVRWIARVLSLVSIGLLAMFIFAGNESFSPTARELLGLALFPGAVIVGLALAWRFEGIGGAIAIGGLAAFYFWHQAIDGTWPGGPWFALFASPAALFVICRLLAGQKSSDAIQNTPGANPA